MDYEISALLALFKMLDLPQTVAYLGNHVTMSGARPMPPNHLNRPLMTAAAVYENLAIPHVA